MQFLKRIIFVFDRPFYFLTALRMEPRAFVLFGKQALTLYHWGICPKPLIGPFTPNIHPFPFWSSFFFYFFEISFFIVSFLSWTPAGYWNLWIHCLTMLLSQHSQTVPLSFPKISISYWEMMNSPPFLLKYPTTTPPFSLHYCLIISFQKISTEVCMACYWDQPSKKSKEERKKGWVEEEIKSKVILEEAPLASTRISTDWIIFQNGSDLRQGCWALKSIVWSQRMLTLN